MSRFALLCFLQIFMVPLVFAQQGKKPQHLDQVYKLPAAIYDVKGMGKWKKGADTGQIRLVIARTNKRDEVYLQWVKWDKQGPNKVVSTVMVKEIQEAANFKTTFIRRETIDGSRQIVLGLENLYDKSSSRATLHVTGVGRYRCKM